MDDSIRWAAVVRRDAAYDGRFVYCVKSTKIFCRPICKARLARRMNVTFCDTPAEARAAGYRPCKRCQPLLAEYHPEADKIKKACQFLQALEPDAPLPGLESLAREAGLTKHHFHRLFKRETGMTPRVYAVACRGFKDGGSSASVSDNLSPITPVENSDEMTRRPSFGGENDFGWDWRQVLTGPDPYGFDLIGYVLDDAAKDISIDQIETVTVYSSIVETTYGHLLIAFKGEQVCKLELGSNDTELTASLESALPSLYYLHSHVSMADERRAAAYQQKIDAVVSALESPTGKMLDFPADLALGAESDIS